MTDWLLHIVDMLGGGHLFLLACLVLAYLGFAVVNMIDPQDPKSGD